MCYNCAVENVRLEESMFKGNAVDLTWVFLHQVYTVTLTIIWAIYNPEIRRRHPKHEVEGHVRCQIRLILALAEIWPGSEAAADLFARLAGAALRNYDTDLRKSAESASASPPPHQPHYTDHHSPPSSNNGHTSPYTMSDRGSVSDTPSPHATSVMSTFETVYDQANNLVNTPPMPAMTQTSTSASPPPTIPTAEPSYRDFQGVVFDPNFSMTLNPMFVPHSSQQGIPDWLQAWDPPAAQHMPGFAHSPPQPAPVCMTQTEMLNQQAQHDELMRILETESQFDFDGSQSAGWAWSG
jgi:hypothetical protein